MNVRDSPSLVRYVPEAHLRILAQRWKLDKHFSGRSGQSYVDWIRQEEASLASLYGYTPTAGQLKRTVAAAIQDENDFIDYLCSKGGKQVLEKEDELAKLARVAACIIVGLYSDGAASSASTSDRSASRAS